LVLLLVHWDLSLWCFVHHLSWHLLSSLDLTLLSLHLTLLSLHLTLLSWGLTLSLLWSLVVLWSLSLEVSVSLGSSLHWSSVLLLSVWFIELSHWHVSELPLLLVHSWVLSEFVVNHSVVLEWHSSLLWWWHHTNWEVWKYGLIV